MKMDILVSIIITTYNRPSMLERAIVSALNQTLEEIEVLVIDDNHPDTEARYQTEKLMAKYENEQKIRYIKHPKNMNGAAARNTGVKQARGKYITYLDDDDFYHENKVKEQVEYLEQSNFDAVYCGWYRKGIFETPLVEGDLTYEILSGDMLIRTNTIMMNRDVSLEIGGWDERYTRNQEAVYLIKYFNSGYKIGSVDKVLVYYDRTDRGNASKPKKFEKDFDFFLNDHRSTIKKLSMKEGINGNRIYSKRYIGVMLYYLTNKEPLQALKLYFEKTKSYPIIFNHELLKYSKNRLERLIKE